MSRKTALAILIAASIFPFVTAIQVEHEFLGDDQLITLTYAKNIAAGRGFVFNTGDQVLGTTTPLFALVMAGLFFVFPSLPGTSLAVWLTAVCWGVLIWSFFIFRGAFKLTDRQAALIGAVIAVGGWVTYLGMEAYPFALLLVLSAGFAATGRPFTAGITAGLLFLTRGEGVLFFGLLWLAAWWAERSPHGEGALRLVRWAPARMGAGFSIPFAMWSVFAMLSFGNIFPNTLSAKVAQVESGLWKPFHHYLFSDWLAYWSVAPWLGSVGTVLFLALATVGLFLVLARRRALWFLPAWLVAYVAGYVILGVPGAYPWYRLPVEFVLLALVGLGLDGLMRIRRQPAVGGVVAATVLASMAWSTADKALHPTTTAKHRAYRMLSAELAELSTPGQWVAYHEVGYLGYYTELGVVDLVGLVTPDNAERVARLDFSSGFWETRPEYLIYLEGSKFIRPIIEHPQFRAEYASLLRREGFDGQALTVYRRHARPVAQLRSR